MARRVIREQLSGSPKVIRQIFLQFAGDPFNWLRQRGIFCGIYKVSAARPQAFPAKPQVSNRDVHMQACAQKT
jgi:hypothetical protein